MSIIMKGICSECTDGKEKYLAKRHPALCGYHYKLAQQKKSFEKNKDKPKKIYHLKRTPLTYKRKVTGERKLFLEIWDSMKEHKCFVTGEPIHEFHVRNFAHVLPKGQNKCYKFKLYKKNIVLIAADLHTKWDKWLRSKLILLPEWDKMFALESELKEEYEKLYGKRN